MRYYISTDKQRVHFENQCLRVNEGERMMLGEFDDIDGALNRAKQQYSDAENCLRCTYVVAEMGLTTPTSRHFA